MNADDLGYITVLIHIPYRRPALHPSEAAQAPPVLLVRVKGGGSQALSLLARVRDEREQQDKGERYQQGYGHMVRQLSYVCRGHISQIWLITPVRSHAPALPNLYNFAHDGSLECSLAPGGRILQSGQISFSSHLPWRSAEMGSPFERIMARERSRDFNRRRTHKANLPPENS